MSVNMKHAVASGVAAVSLSVLSSTAMAATFANPAVVTYATQGIPATGAITVPGGAVFTSDAFSTGAGGGSALVTVTLPAGVTFVTNPSATVGGNFSSATLSSAGAGQGFAVFSVTLPANAAAAAGSLTLNSFQVTGATALASVTTAGKFQFTEQVSGATGATGTLNQPSVLKADLGLSASQLTVAGFLPALGASVIDITSPSNGAKFKQPAGAAAGVVADIGGTALFTNGFLNSTATAPYAFTATKASETITGNFGGISAAYTAPGACAATATAEASVGGASAGTISGSSLTFTNLPLGPFSEICLYAGGTLISANPNGFTVTGSIDTTTTPLTIAGLPAVLNGYNYNGVTGTVLYGFTGTSGYQQYVRIVNSASTSATVTAAITTDAGTTGTATVETSLAAGTNDLVPISTIIGSSGLTSANSRASIVLFGPNGLSFESLLVSPGGVVSQIQ